jgi:AcrR family transcriptional regulator
VAEPAPRPRRRRARERRSHAERTAETRARIVAAVVESIAEVGFERTTAAQVTSRAGVTWGAVQHHFGDKDGMFVAVLEASFARFAELLEGVPDAGAAAELEKRAALFVDRAWEHFSSPLYRSTFEILRSHLGRDEMHPQDWQARMFRGWDRIWMRIFGDSPAPRRRHLVLQHYTVSLFTGLASVIALEGATARLRPAELELVKHTLVRELSQR